MECPECGRENDEGAATCAGCGADLSSAGRIGRFELRSELGRGAMARVWRAWDPNLHREVAIKEPMFDPRLPSDVLDEMGRRFVREGQTAAGLNHPNIVTIHEADVYDGRPAIVMELVDGATLTDLLERGPLAPTEALDALDQLLDAVGYAHSRGVVHRDIKPDNVFVSSGGHVKLADFGIAHVDDASATRATVVGSVLGTPGYMSPEQATGAPVDARSDLFSIGVVAYEMLAGRNPFGAGDGGDATTLLYRIVHEPAPELPDASVSGLPADLRPAIMAALSKDPAGRPQDAAAFKAMLHGSATPETPRRISTSDGTALSAAVGRTREPAARKALPYVAVGLAGLVILILVFAGANAGTTGGAAGAPAAADAGTSPGALASQQAYLAASGDYVAVYTTGNAKPYRVSDVLVSDLDPDFAAQLSTHVPFATIDEALAKIDELREQAAIPDIPHDFSAPFWGVWTYESEDAQDAAAFADELTEQGFASDVVPTNEWELLAIGNRYAVVTGTWSARKDAEDMAALLHDAGYTSASVKNTGEHADGSRVIKVCVEKKDGGWLSGIVHRDDNDCVISDSSVRAYSWGELEGMGLTDAELCVAWNEPFARLGFHFGCPGLRDYFNTCSWFQDGGVGYHPSVTGAAAVNNGLLRDIASSRPGADEWKELVSNP